MPGGSGGLTLPTSTSTSLPCADADAFVTALRALPAAAGGDAGAWAVAARVLGGDAAVEAAIDVLDWEVR